MKKIGYIVVLIISFSIINGLVHSIYSLSQKNNLIAKTREELESEKEQNLRLSDQLQQVKRPEFIEEQARNKLFLVKPGESLVLLPTPKDKEAATEKPDPLHELPVWKQWIYIFWGVSV